MKTLIKNINQKAFTKFITLVLSLSFVFNACMKEVEFDDKLLESKLVINGFVCADSSINVKVAISKPIPGVKQNMEWIDKAIIKLYVDGEFTEELQNVKLEYDNNDEYYYYDVEKPSSEYRSEKTIAQTGKKYKIEVEYDGFGMAWAETIIPEKVVIDTMRTDVKEITEYGYTESRKFYYLKFTDPQNEKNYYRLSVSTGRGRRSTIWNSDTEQYEVVDTIKEVYVSYEFDTYINSDDPLLTGNEDADDYLFIGNENDYNLFTDELINGQQYELSYNNYYNSYYYLEGDMNEGDFFSNTVKLMNLTREAYLYIKSSHEHWLNDENYLTEPVQVYTNINNGIGVFAGYSIDEYSFMVGDYPIDSMEYIFDYYF
ncbi:MAG: DUF4249 domain-containing protein [Prolixibacteraceae bacterium]|jgi:hypothetical protein|nr:DUF4249 domain-containing protein [Prolixibacteraceae bacterium]